MNQPVYNIARMMQLLPEFSFQKQFNNKAIFNAKDIFILLWQVVNLLQHVVVTWNSLYRKPFNHFNRLHCENQTQSQHTICTIAVDV